MFQSHYRWIRENGKRMDSDLRSYLIRRFRIFRWIPCILHHSLIKVLHRLKRIRVLVRLEDPVFSSSQFEHSLSSFGVPSAHYFGSIHTYSLSLSMSQLQEMMKLPEVKKVYLDRKVHALLDTASPTTGAPIAWSHQNQGEGATIAVIDTGIHKHPDLTQPTNRIIGFLDQVNKKTEPYDDNGHGTHCAGDAAGNGVSSDGKYRGPASKAPLVGVKVLNKLGSGNLSDVIAGIQWCINHKEEYNIRVISLSLGSRTNESYKDDPVAQIVEEAWEKGIVVVAAAGNDGPNSHTISSPGTHPRIITVGATDDRGTPDPTDDTIASFSSRGPTADGITKPDITAPGTNITSLRAPRSYIEKTSPDSKVDEHYATLSGTSMATPIVAGIVAILLTEHPDWTPDQVKSALLEKALDMGFPPNTQGAGQVQVDPSFFKE